MSGVNCSICNRLLDFCELSNPNNPVYFILPNGTVQCSTCVNDICYFCNSPFASQYYYIARTQTGINKPNMKYKHNQQVSMTGNVVLCIDCVTKSSPSFNGNSNSLPSLSNLHALFKK